MRKILAFTSDFPCSFNVRPKEKETFRQQISILPFEKMLRHRLSAVVELEHVIFSSLNVSLES